MSESKLTLNVSANTDTQSLIVVRYGPTSEAAAPTLLIEGPQSVKWDLQKVEKNYYGTDLYLQRAGKYILKVGTESRLLEVRNRKQLSFTSEVVLSLIGTLTLAGAITLWALKKRRS